MIWNRSTSLSDVCLDVCICAFWVGRSGRVEGDCGETGARLALVPAAGFLWQ